MRPQAQVSFDNLLFIRKYRFLPNVYAILGSSLPAENISDISMTSTSDLQSAVKTTTSGNKRKKISSVWKYFKRSGDKKFAKCVTCGKEYKTSGNTSNLADHLKRFHQIQDQPEISSASSSNTDLTSSSARSSVRSVSPFFRRSVFYDSNSQRKKELDQCLALMIATDMQPFNIVNDKGFQKFVKLLDPRYEIPNKGTVKSIMTKLYTEAEVKLKEILQGIRWVAITTDCWTSVSTESYISATCHFIDKSFELKTALLSVKHLSDNHTSQNITNSLSETFTEWNIENKVVCIVTDNASNMIKACELLKKRHLPCFAHSLNLAVQENLKLECVANLILKCKGIVAFFKSSTVAMDLFKKEQSALNNGQPLKLIQEVTTRWNSCYYMIKRLLETEKPLNCTLLKLRKAPTPLGADDISILKDIMNCLECFEEATNKISGGTYVTISLIIPVSFGIYSNLFNSTPNLTTEAGKQFCAGLIESVKKRLFQYESRSVTRISTILDPRFKKEGLFSIMFLF